MVLHDDDRASTADGSLQQYVACGDSNRLSCLLCKIFVRFGARSSQSSWLSRWAMGYRHTINVPEASGGSGCVQSLGVSQCRASGVQVSE